jgi:hypothetical protein
MALATLNDPLSEKELAKDELEPKKERMICFMPVSTFIWLVSFAAASSFLLVDYSHPSCSSS